jgi:hypothetical protein
VFNRDKRETGEQLLRAEVDRLAALSLPALGTEVMTKVFGPGGPGADGTKQTVVGASNEFISDEAAWSDDDATREELVRIVGEGLQVLEHASLVISSVVFIGTQHFGTGWTTTRLGDAQLASGDVAATLGSRGF